MKQRSSGKLEESIIFQSKIEEVQKELSEKIHYIDKLNAKITEIEKSKEEALQKLTQSEQKIK